MKTNALQMARAYVYDFRNVIEGNVAEHLLSTLDSVNNYDEYLSEEEIEEYENCSNERKSEIEQEVKSLILRNFNFDINNFEY